MIALDPAPHADFVFTLRLAVERIDADLARCAGTGAALRSQWAGRACRAWDEAQGSWTARMTVLRETLGAAAEGMARAGATLARAEANATAVWG